MNERYKVVKLRTGLPINPVEGQRYKSEVYVGFAYVPEAVQLMADKLKKVAFERGLTVRSIETYFEYPKPFGKRKPDAFDAELNGEFEGTLEQAEWYRKKLEEADKTLDNT